MLTKLISDEDRVEDKMTGVFDDLKNEIEF